MLGRIIGLVGSREVISSALATLTRYNWVARFLGFFPQKLKNGEPQMNALQNAIATHVQIPLSHHPNSQREKVTILIIASPEGVRENVHEATPKPASEADYCPHPIQAKS